MSQRGSACRTMVLEEVCGEVAVLEISAGCAVSAVPGFDEFEAPNDAELPPKDDSESACNKKSRSSSESESADTDHEVQAPFENPCIDESILSRCSETIEEMYQLCQQAESLGAWSKMSSDSRVEYRGIRSKIWDCFEALCKQINLQTTTEALSSASGCLPGIFADTSPSKDALGKIVLNELSMMK